jgi:hypothetical protein
MTISSDQDCCHQHVKPPTFYLYDDSGTLLRSDSLTAIIPSASGRETGAALTATNSGTTAVDLYHLDYIAVTRSSDRTR